MFYIGYSRVGSFAGLRSTIVPSQFILSSIVLLTYCSLILLVSNYCELPFQDPVGLSIYALNVKYLLS